MYPLAGEKVKSDRQERGGTGKRWFPEPVSVRRCTPDAFRSLNAMCVRRADNSPEVPPTAWPSPPPPPPLPSPPPPPAATAAAAAAAALLHLLPRSGQRKAATLWLPVAKPIKHRYSGNFKRKIHVIKIYYTVLCSFTI